VTNVNKTVIHNTYVNNSFKKNVNVNRTSFNGPNGVKAQPTAEQKAATANAKKMPPTSQQLERQEAAKTDPNLHAAKNGQVNNEAIKSFNQTHGQGKGGENVGAAGAGAGNKPGNVNERNLQGAGAGKTGNEPGNVTDRNIKGEGAAAGAGKAENRQALDHAGIKGAAKAEHHGAVADNAGAGKVGANGNKLKTGNQGNRTNMGGNQAKMHTGKMGGTGGHPGQPHTMNQMSRNPQMGARNAQMGGKHPQMQGGGNRPPPPPKGQPQGKKKPNER
jgi:hypothetical protein